MIRELKAELPQCLGKVSVLPQFPRHLFGKYLFIFSLSFIITIVLFLPSFLGQLKLMNFFPTTVSFLIFPGLF